MVRVILFLNTFKTMTTATSIKKSEATRARILDVALDLFRRHGFEETTMRGIAAAADVSLGSAYYYFQSKEDLVMAFYERAIEAMTSRMEAALSGASRFEEKVEALMAVKFEYFEPDRTFLGALLRHSADPQKLPVAIQRGDKAHIWELDQAYFARMIDESRDVRVPTELAPHLPKLAVAISTMGLILYWIRRIALQVSGKRGCCLGKSLALLVSGLKVAGFALLKPSCGQRL